MAYLEKHYSSVYDIHPIGATAFLVSGLVVCIGTFTSPTRPERIVGAMTLVFLIAWFIFFGTSY